MFSANAKFWDPIPFILRLNLIFDFKFGLSMKFCVDWYVIIICIFLFWRCFFNYFRICVGEFHDFTEKRRNESENVSIPISILYQPMWNFKLNLYFKSKLEFNPRTSETLIWKFTWALIFPSNFSNFWLKMVNSIKVMFLTSARPKHGFHFSEEQVVQANASDVKQLSLLSSSLVAMSFMKSNQLLILSSVSSVNLKREFHKKIRKFEIL